MHGAKGRNASFKAVSVFARNRADLLQSRASWHHKVHWLVAPSVGDVAFATRSALAAGLSLLIAMWMELDSPQWAPLTVWVVAQSSRGESLSKARWRIAGSVLGCVIAIGLISAFPQASALFFCVLALWIGICCGLATFLQSYRAYGLVLTGFTSAIVATGAISQPDDVFNVAIARGTYIILGVVCEAVLAMLFTPSLREQARKNLEQRLDGALKAVTACVNDLVNGKIHPQSHAQVLTTLVTANSRIEFDALEIGQAKHIADHARAALSEMMVMLARARGGALLAQADGTGPSTATVPSSVSLALRDDYNRIQQHIYATEHPIKGDHFRFQTASRRHAQEAVENGIRSCAGILAGWLVWEITAWPAGAGFISFVALVYGLLATRENPILASGAFFKGAVWCAVVAALYVLIVLPALTAPEFLLVALMVPMTIGGLAARQPATAGYAFSFNMFLPVLLGPTNQSRYDEQAFFNGALCFLIAVLFVGWTYRVVLPFRPDSHMVRTGRWRQQRLRALAAQSGKTTLQQWLSESADSLVRILRNAQGISEPTQLAYMQNQFRLTNIGMNIIILRDIQRDQALPPPVRRVVRVFLRKWHQDAGQTVRWSSMTQGWLARQLGLISETHVHAQIEKAIGSLRLIAAEHSSTPNVD